MKMNMSSNFQKGKSNFHNSLSSIVLRKLTSFLNLIPHILLFPIGFFVYVEFSILFRVDLFYTYFRFYLIFLKDLSHDWFLFENMSKKSLMKSTPRKNPKIQASIRTSHHDSSQLLLKPWLDSFEFTFHHI